MKNFLLGLLAALLVAMAFAQSKPDSRPVWEYKMLAFETVETDTSSTLDTKYADVQTKLDELGKDGWELVLTGSDFVATADEEERWANRLVLKRPIKR